VIPNPAGSSDEIPSPLAAEFRIMRPRERPRSHCTHKIKPYMIATREGQIGY